jgi:hypothetical protein
MYPNAGGPPMSDEQPEYVHRIPDGGWQIQGTRVSLDSVVYLFLGNCLPSDLVHGAAAHLA